MKKLLCLVLSVVLLATPLISCGCNNTEEPPHTHTYDTSKWEYSNSGHWNPSTCDHDAVKGNAANHADANSDGICDVCGFDQGHAHVDGDKNGHCDICDYDYDHSHIYSNDWAWDADAHWYADLCGHGTVSDKADHDYTAAGFCKVCNYSAGADIEIDSVKTALDLAAAQEHLVLNGNASIIMSEDYGSWGFSSQSSLNYKYGNGYFIVNERGDEGNFEYVYTALDDDSVYAVKNTLWNGEIERTDVLNEASIENLAGYKFSAMSINGDFEGEYYGLVALISALYAQGMSEEATEFTPVFEDGVYGFSYTIQPYEITEIAVLFTLDPYDYTLNNVSITSATYGELYDEDWNYLGFSEVPYKVYELAAVQGSMPPANPFDPADVLMSDYELVDADGNPIGDTIEMNIGESVTIYVKSKDADTNMALQGIQCLFDEETWPISAAFMHLDDMGEEVNAVAISAYRQGEHSLVVTAACGVEKELTIKVNPAETTFIDVNLVVNDWWSQVDEHTIYVGTELYIGSLVNDFADDSFTATTTGGTLTDGDYYGTACKVFSASQAGDYTVTITSSANSALTSSAVIHVVEAPSVAELVVGAYKYEGWPASTTVVFTPDSEGATTGTVVFSNYDGEETMTYSVDADGVFTLTHVDGAELNLSLRVNLSTYAVELGVLNYMQELEWYPMAAASTAGIPEVDGDYFSIDDDVNIYFMASEGYCLITSCDVWNSEWQLYCTFSVGTDLIMGGYDVILIPDAESMDNYGECPFTLEGGSYVLEDGSSIVLCITLNGAYTEITLTK